MTNSGDFLLGIGLLHQGRIARARRIFARVVREGDERAPWACQQALQTFIQGGELKEATAWLRAAAAGQTAILELGLGYLSRRSGPPAASARHLARAYAVDPHNPLTLLELAWLAHVEGRVGYAHTLVDAATARSAARRDAWGAAASLAQRAAFSVAEERLDLALELSERAARRRRRLGDRLGLGYCLQLRGKALYLRADFTGAMAALRAALAIHENAGHHLDAAAIHNNIGLWQLDLSNPELARDAFRAALAALRRIGDRGRQAITLANLGNTHDKLGDRTGSERAYGRALALLGPGAEPDVKGIAIAELAEARTRAGRPLDGIATLRGFSAELRRRCRWTTRLLIDTERARADLALGEPRRARRELGRQLAAIARRPQRSRDVVLPHIKAEIVYAATLVATGAGRAAVSASRRLCRRLDLVRGKQTSAAVRMGLVESHQDAHDVLCQALLAVGPPSRAWRAVAAHKAVELRNHESTGAARLGDHAALVEYHTARETTYVFTSCRGRVRVANLRLSATTLELLLDRVLKPLRSAAVDARDPFANLEELDLDHAAHLYRAVLAPALAYLPPGIERVVIVPDGPLHAVPFELMVSHRSRSHPPSYPALAGFDEPCYGLERFVMSYAPSSIGGDATRVPAARPLTRWLALAHSPRAMTGFHTLDGPLQLAPLAGVDAEVTRIAKLFPESRVLTGGRATASAYVEAAPSQDVIHIAAHAIADLRSAEHSGVVVAPAPGDANAIGFLSAAAIREIPLRAALVVLSACDTVRGRPRAREGVLGIARAFLDAGAQAVVASLWPVDDEATQELMWSFYRCLRSGLDSANALAAAKRELRHRCDRHAFPTRAHPFFWAPFVLLERNPGCDVRVRPRIP